VKKVVVQIDCRDSRDRDVGVTRGGQGTLADPREKQDYFVQLYIKKYTGSFLDNILGGGYRACRSIHRTISI
jgi:hypothetical protein